MLSAPHYRSLTPPALTFSLQKATAYTVGGTMRFSRTPTRVRVHFWGTGMIREKDVNALCGKDRQRELKQYKEASWRRNCM
jgi:hypothetical protein